MTRAVLIRPGAVTHANDMAQRDDEPRRDRGRRRPDAHARRATPTVAPPGYYMLFVLDADGVPSVANWVRVTARPRWPPSPPPRRRAVTPASPTAADHRDPPGPFRVRTLAASLAGHGQRVILSVRVKTTAAASARITLLRGGRAVAARTVPLRAGRTAAPHVAIRRAALRGARTVTLQVALTHGGRVTTAQRTLRVPTPR